MTARPHDVKGGFVSLCEHGLFLIRNRVTRSGVMELHLNGNCYLRLTGSLRSLQRFL